MKNIQIATIVTCTLCKGRGDVGSIFVETCPACRGTGKVTKPISISKLKQLLKDECTGKNKTIAGSNKSSRRNNKKL